MKLSLDLGKANFAGLLLTDSVVTGWRLTTAVRVRSRASAHKMVYGHPTGQAVFLWAHNRQQWLDRFSKIHKNC